MDSFYVTTFLLSLATGNRISELHSCLRGEEHLEFSNLGVTLFPNPNFLAKNEDPASRRGPLFISNLFDAQGSAHPLCPVVNLQKYLSLTSSTRSWKLFVHPVTLSDITTHKLNLYLCKFIRLGNPGCFPKAHDLRKFATSMAFLRGLDKSDVCDLVGWSSINVFKKHYLKQIEEISSPLIVLGSRVPGSAKDCI